MDNMSYMGFTVWMKKVITDFQSKTNRPPNFYINAVEMHMKKWN